MPNVLTNLTIREVSGVDRGAGEGVRVMLMKSADAEALHFDLNGISATVLAKALLDSAPMVSAAILGCLAKIETEALEYEKRTFTADQRRSAASEGAAMPDGSFPIKTVEDLHNAVRLVGHAKDPSAAKKHIISRAKALGASGELPAGWMAKSQSPFMKQMLERLGITKREDSVGHEALEKGLGAVHQSLCSIICSDNVNKKELIEKSIGQFAEYVLKTMPENLADSMSAAGLVAEVSKMSSDEDDLNKGDIDMTKEELAKAVGDAVGAAMAPVAKSVATLEAQVAFMKLSPEQQAYCVKKGMTDEQKKAFAGKSKEECDDEMKKDAAKDADKDDKGNPFAKRMTEVEKSNGELKAELAKRDENDAIAVIAKRIEPIGGTADLAKSLHALAKTDKPGADLIEKTLAASHAQAKAGNLFRVIGVDKSRDASDPIGAMNILVDAVMKAANDSGKPLTKAQAIMKIGESRDADHQKVWKAYKEASSAPAVAAA